MHPVARQGFADGRRYDRARPGYPDDAVDWLVDRLGVAAGDPVVDVAAGTGKLTRPLLARGLAVVAVEPVAEMSRVLRSTASVPVVAGVAEALPLRGRSFAAATVAQAQHWFDRAASAAEYRRVLRPRGRVGLIWNVRDRSVPWVDAVWSIMDRVEKKAPWRHHEASGEEQLPGFSPPQRAEFHHVHTTDRAGVQDRISSVSHVAVLPDRERRAVLDEVRSVLDGAGIATEVAVPYRVEVFVMEHLGQGR